MTWLLVGVFAGRSSEMKQARVLFGASRNHGSQMPCPTVLGWPLLCVQLDSHVQVRPWSVLLNTSTFCAVKSPTCQAVPAASRSPWFRPFAVRGTSYRTGAPRSQPEVCEVIVEMGLAVQVRPPSVLR